MEIICRIDLYELSEFLFMYVYHNSDTYIFFIQCFTA